MAQHFFANTANVIHFIDRILLAVSKMWFFSASVSAVEQGGESRLT